MTVLFRYEYYNYFPKTIKVPVVTISLESSRFYVTQIFRLESKEFTDVRGRHNFPYYAILHLKSYVLDKLSLQYSDFLD